MIGKSCGIVELHEHRIGSRTQVLGSHRAERLEQQHRGRRVDELAEKLGARFILARSKGSGLLKRRRWVGSGGASATEDLAVFDSNLVSAVVAGSGTTDHADTEIIEQLIASG